ALVLPPFMVGDGGLVVPALEGVVGDERGVVDADAAEAAGVGAEQFPDLLGVGGPDVGRAGGVDQLLLVEVVVAAEQQNRGLAVDDVNQGLDLPLGSGDVGVGVGEGLDGAQPRCGEPLHLPGFAVIDRVEGAGRLLQVGPVAAVPTGDDPVLTGLGALNELDGLGATHGAGGGFYVDGGEPEAGE